jgi:hypothetical protein
VKIAVRAHVVNGEDVGMVDGAQHAGFVLEALQAVGIAGKGFGQDLDRDVAGQTGVACSIDFSHTARAQGRLNLVGAQFRAGG